MTVEELKGALDGLPAGAPAVVYADLQGEVTRPFADLEERVTVCGYYALATVERLPGEAVLVLGQALPM